MTRSSKDKWNTIYSKNREVGSPAAVLLENKDKLPPNGTALDIACGNGANALLLAECGLKTTAWDISDVAIKQLNERAGTLPLYAEVIDITSSSFGDQSFDVIVNCHFLDRSLTDAILAALVPGGVIFFQTFARERLNNSGPSNPDFLLEKGELKEMMRDMEILSYRDGSMIDDANDSLTGREYIVAKKPLRQKSTT